MLTTAFIFNLSLWGNDECWSAAEIMGYDKLILLLVPLEVQMALKHHDPVEENINYCSHEKRSESDVCKAC